MTCRAYHSFFRNFAGKSNLAIITLLRTGSKSVMGIANATGMEQSAVSHSLRKLSACNIVSSERNGKEKRYSLNRETVLPLLKLVESHVEKNCKGCALHGK